MAETQFISHSQVVPPAMVPRRGIGLFGAVGIVVGILAAALTGGLVVLERSLAASADDAKGRLVELRRELEIDSINAAKTLQNRIEIAQQILNGHVYGSQALNFVESNILDGVRVISFAYADKKVSLDLLAPGYLVYAQQIKYFRTVDEIEKGFNFPPPELNERGEVSFSIDLSLTSSFIHDKPSVDNTVANDTGGFEF
ncbi:MAG: hypothetical protein O2794_02685 [bacterium]|nr:hypothetical protein [bacterium]